MAKYIFTNWETVPIKRKTFEGQLDRFVKVCVASVDNPQKVLFILPLFGKENRSGFSNIIEVVRNHELGQDEKSRFSFTYLQKPVKGEFVEVPSKHGPLFRTFTKDESRYGLCAIDQVGKVERDVKGKVKIYHNIKVFCLYKENDVLGKQYLSGWHPNDWYYRFFGYNYDILNNLTEPLQL